MSSTTVPATFGSGAAVAVSVGVEVGLAVSLGVAEVGPALEVPVLGVPLGSGVPPLSSDEHAASPATERPAPPRNNTRLVARTPM
jgi:hypothetical protein